MLNSILSNNLDEVKRLLTKYHVKRAYAFGSVCTERFNTDSDIDLLIAFNDGLDPIVYADCYFLLADALENLFKRPVDLVTERSLSNPYFIESLNRTKIPIYES